MPEPSSTPRAVAASVIFATRNRSDLLRQAVQAAYAQSVPVEVIVLDDGSTDDTGAMIQREFPQAIYRRYEGGRGPCFLRNRGAELATASIIFPIDDDSIMVSTRCVEQTLVEFANPRVGVVGMPFINVRKDNVVRQRAAGKHDVEVVHAYVGAAHAMRRDLFLELGGYREHFFYMGEEGDYSLRLLNRGYVTRLGAADPTHHHESPSRSLERAGIYGRQNDVLFVWHNVPLPDMLIHLPVTTLRGVLFGFRVGHPWWMLKGLLRGYGLVFRYWNKRSPVSRIIYHLNRRLKKGGAMPLAGVEPLLPPMKAGR